MAALWVGRVTPCTICPCPLGGLFRSQNPRSQTSGDTLCGLHPLDSAHHAPPGQWRSSEFVWEVFWQPHRSSRHKVKHVTACCPVNVVTLPAGDRQHWRCSRGHCAVAGLGNASALLTSAVIGIFGDHRWGCGCLCLTCTMWKEADEVQYEGKVKKNHHQQQHFNSASSRNSRCSSQLDHLVPRLCFCFCSWTAGATVCRVFQCGGLGRISGRHSSFLQMRTRKMEANFHVFQVSPVTPVRMLAGDVTQGWWSYLIYVCFTYGMTVFHAAKWSFKRILLSVELWPCQWVGVTLWSINSSLNLCQMCGNI